MSSILVRSTPGLLSRVSLRTVLRLDSAVTGANGAAYLLAAGPLGDLLGLDAVLLRVLGVVLLAFATVVWLTAARPVVPRAAVRAIVAINAAWVAASVVVAIGGWTSPTVAGAVWIVAQAIVVAGFAELQVAALKR